MVGTPEAWVVVTTHKMPFPMEGFGDSEGGGQGTVWWSSYIEALGTSKCSSFELMPTESSSVGKEDRCASLVRNLVLDGIGSSYVVPAVLWYSSSNGEKNEGEPWYCDAYSYAPIIPWTYGAVISYALWYKKMNRNCSCQKCKGWCRYCWGKVMERGWNSVMVYTTTH